MKKYIKLFEDFKNHNTGVIREQKDGTHSPMAYLADALTPLGFVKTNSSCFYFSFNANTNLGPKGEFNGLTKGNLKGTDENGANIYYSSSDNKIYLNVYVGGVEKVNKKYSKSAPKYLLDHKQILNDLGIYKTYNF